MITLQDLKTRFGEQELAQLTDRENYQVIDIDVVNKAIADAQQEANSYLLAAGLVVLNAQGESTYSGATVPAVLIGKLCDMARYYLHEDGVIGIVKERYDNAIIWLKQVMRTPTMLTGTQASQAAHAQAGSSVAVLPNPVPSMWQD